MNLAIEQTKPLDNAEKFRQFWHQDRDNVQAIREAYQVCKAHRKKFREFLFYATTGVGRNVPWREQFVEKQTPLPETRRSGARKDGVSVVKSSNFVANSVSSGEANVGQQ
jgi:hypothetical protein